MENLVLRFAEGGNPIMNGFSAAWTLACRAVVPLKGNVIEEDADDRSWHTETPGRGHSMGILISCRETARVIRGSGRVRGT